MSQLRYVELADECESIKTNTNYVLAGFMTHWRASSRACSRLNFCEVLFFSLKELSQLRGAEPATWRWASYEALSQLRGIEPATWRWASYVALSQQGSFELHHIYIPMQSQPYNILNLGQNIFLRETRTFELERECEIYHSSIYVYIYIKYCICRAPTSSISSWVCLRWCFTFPIKKIHQKWGTQWESIGFKKWGGLTLW